MSLYIIATPIGNLSDISQRAVDTLKLVDYIYCEDTRVTVKLLNYFGITDKKLISLNKENERKRVKEVISSLEKGFEIALVSDAGTPLISDPGSCLLSELWAYKNNLDVQNKKSPDFYPIGGISALTTALSVCPIDCSRFCFEGFLPHGGKQRRRVLRKLLLEERALVFYESPHRIIDTLEDLQAIFFSDIETDEKCHKEDKVFFAREMTKIHEEYFYGSISEAIDYLQNKFPKKKIQGEFVLIF